MGNFWSADLHRRDRVSYVCGVLGLVGCVMAVLGDVIGVLVHDDIGFVSDTISDLAAGEHSWIQDLGLCGFSVGMVVVAFALYRWRLDDWRWRTGAVLLALLGASIFVLAVHDEYGDREPGGVVIHMYLVFVLGIGFAAVSLLTSPGFRDLRHGWSRFSLTVAVLWIAAAPLFFVVPTTWDGLYERAIAVLIVLWVGIVSRLLMRSGRGDLEAG